MNSKSSNSSQQEVENRSEENSLLERSYYEDERSDVPMLPESISETNRKSIKSSKNKKTVKTLNNLSEFFNKKEKKHVSPAIYSVTSAPVGKTSYSKAHNRRGNLLYLKERNTLTTPSSSLLMKEKYCIESPTDRIGSSYSQGDKRVFNNDDRFVSSILPSNDSQVDTNTVEVLLIDNLEIPQDHQTDSLEEKASLDEKSDTDDGILSIFSLSPLESEIRNTIIRFEQSMLEKISQNS